jgi:protease-4
MIKRFFTVVLGTIAGIWISVILLAITALMLFGSVIGSFMSSAGGITTKEQSILYLNMSGNIAEREQSTGIIDGLSMDDEDNDLTLESIINSINYASNDESIKGIYLDCNGSSLGVASRQEIIEALNKFKAQGKWIYAYSNNYTQGDYWIASAANEIYLNPVGSLDLHGLAAQTQFYKGLLDKVGVEMQVLRVGTYKSAVEPYMLTEMSPDSRLQTQIFVNGIWNQICSQISDYRKISQAKLNAMADSLIVTWSPEYVLDKKLITKIAYRRDFENILRKKLSIKADKELPTITPSEYLTNNSKLFKENEEHIAILYAVGDIVESGNGGIVSKQMVPEIVKLADNDKVKALILRVNSGGGSAFASEQIWEALEYFKSKNKPYYVSMGDMAASGGYYISCGADKIYCDETTLTGSIGIFGIIPCVKELATGKLGITTSDVVSNTNAAFPSIMKPMTEMQREEMQSMINRGYETFVARCAKGRKMSTDSIKSIAEGRVWYGVDAKRIGLVDKLGSLAIAINDIAKVAKIDSKKVISYPMVEENPLNQIIKGAYKYVSIDNLNIKMLNEDELATLKKVTNQLNSMTPIQAKAEDIVIK